MLTASERVVEVAATSELPPAMETALKQITDNNKIGLGNMAPNTKPKTKKLRSLRQEVTVLAGKPQTLVKKLSISR